MTTLRKVIRNFFSFVFLLMSGFIYSQSSDTIIKREGHQSYHPDNGTIAVDGKFKESKESGVILEYKSVYNKKKQLIREGSFKKNKFWSGEEYFYNSAGEIIRIKMYKEGKYTGDADLPH